MQMIIAVFWFWIDLFEQTIGEIISLFSEPYCQDCYAKDVALKCVACEQPILSVYTSALSGYWHPQCFVCQEPNCGPFRNAKFFEYQKRPYCERHYLKLIGWYT